MKARVVRTIVIILLAATGAMSIRVAQAGSPSPSGQEPSFQVKFSEPLAVYDFVKNLSSKAFVPDNPFKKLFASSKFNQEKYQRLIAEFDKLNINYTYEFTEYVNTSKESGSTVYLLKKNLINSRTVDDFKVSSLGIIPNENLFKLASILTEFTPVYRELVYQPSKEIFERQLAEIKSLIASTDTTSYFNAGIKFYNSSWDNTVPFNFVVYPLPNSRGFTATVYSNNAESAIPTSLTNYNALLSVMFHEIFHTLHDEESLSLKKDMAQWINSNPSKNRHYATGLLLNESLATALGNGYVSAKLSGKLNERNWYNWKYVNLMAKKIYPVVEEYIEKQRPIDKAFIDSYIKIFDDNFSDWLLEPDLIMAASYVVSDDAEDFNIIDQKFPYRPTAENKEGISRSSIEKMANAPSTKVVIVSKDNKRNLQLVKESFAELQNWKPDAKTDFTYSVLLKDKTYLIVINSVRKTTKEQIEALKLT
ncbi:MAG TPA: hypothetical protein VN256_10805 [Pyrinomonadaceae bacterium]|nr:hypothetical protein [Pyrinomonadaceae bacterium]